MWICASATVNTGQRPWKLVRASWKFGQSLNGLLSASHTQIENVYSLSVYSTLSMLDMRYNMFYIYVFLRLDLASTVPEFMDPVFAKTRQKRSFSMAEK